MTQQNHVQTICGKSSRPKEPCPTRLFQNQTCSYFIAKGIRTVQPFISGHFQQKLAVIGWKNSVLREMLESRPQERPCRPRMHQQCGETTSRSYTY